MKLYPQLVKICKSDGMDVEWCKMIDNPRMQCCKGSHNHSVKTHVWLLKTYLFFLGGSKILKRKGSVHWNIITFLMLFNLVKSLHHKTILQYPLHPIPLLSLTSLSWGIPVYISICSWEYSSLSFLEMHVHDIWDFIPFHGCPQGGGSHRAVDTTRVLTGHDHIRQQL